MPNTPLHSVKCILHKRQLAICLMLGSGGSGLKGYFSARQGLTSRKCQTSASAPLTSTKNWSQTSALGILDMKRTSTRHPRSRTKPIPPCQYSSQVRYNWCKSSKYTIQEPEQPLCKKLDPTEHQAELPSECLRAGTLVASR